MRCVRQFAAWSTSCAHQAKAHWGVADCTANHCYFYQNGNRACTSHNGFDTGWRTGTSSWSLGASLNWLAGKATP